MFDRPSECRTHVGWTLRVHNAVGLLLHVTEVDAYKPAFSLSVERNWCSISL